jgi:sugar/nucleoside kinase (ribokinase family)
MDGVTCIGGTLTDILARPVRMMPNPGRVELVDEMRLAPGGCAVNSASALTRLGVPARLIGRIGRDGLGDFLVRALADRGIDVAGLAATDAGTSASMVFVSQDGERSILHAIGSMGTFDGTDIDWSLAARSRIFFVAQFGLLGRFDWSAASALARARDCGMLTALDTVWDATGGLSDKIAPCLPLLDYFLPSYDEAKHITGLTDPGEMARFFQDRGVGTVGIKLGEDGCYLRGPEGKEVTVSAFPVTEVDATGAGDAWCAGFLAGVLSGRDLVEAGRLGNAVAACCVTALGAYDGIRTMAETLAFMAGAGIEEGVRSVPPADFHDR